MFILVPSLPELSVLMIQEVMCFLALCSFNLVTLSHFSNFCQLSPSNYGLAPPDCRDWYANSTKIHRYRELCLVTFPECSLDLSHSGPCRLGGVVGQFMKEEALKSKWVWNVSSLTALEWAHWALWAGALGQVSDSDRGGPREPGSSLHVMEQKSKRRLFPKCRNGRRSWGIGGFVSLIGKMQEGWREEEELNFKMREIWAEVT